MPAQVADRWNPFDRAFVEAVLEVRGVHVNPTLEDFRHAVAILSEYYTALTLTPVAREGEALAFDGGYPDHELLGSVATQCAFLFTQYGIACWSHAGIEQTEAYTRWRDTGKLPDQKPRQAHG